MRSLETTVLHVDGLDVDAGQTPLLRDVGFTIGAGERVGLIGESGSGKSLTALSIMGLLPDGLSASGSVELDGRQVVGAREADLARMRGNDVAMVFQEPMTALNPTMTVGKQVAEIMRIHGVDRRAASTAAVRLLDIVGIPDPAEAARAYPHHFSGGQRQRIVLAIALANEPDLLICDEPTTALDVTVQQQMLELILEGATERDAALLFITHDLAVVANTCERVLVMYGGRVVEAGATTDVFGSPRHRYTRGLIDASDMSVTDARGRLVTIPGSVPPAGRFPSGCVFANRCGHATEACAVQPPWVGPDADHGHACVHPVEVPSSSPT